MGRPRLRPGENNIDRVRAHADPRDPGGKRLQWAVCLWSGRIVRRETRGHGATVGELRARAHEKAAELLRTGGRAGAWRGASDMGEYIARDVIPRVERCERLGENTRRGYVRYLGFMRDSLRGLTIADAARASVLGGVFADIARAHGTATARHCITVTDYHVMRPLIMADVLAANPIAGVRFELPQIKASKKFEGGRGLDCEEWRRCVNWLLGVDWAATPKPERGRFTQAQAAARRRAAVEITALQAVTGLRIGEARRLTWAQISDDCAHIDAPPEGTKTKRGRIIEILDWRVIDRLRARREESGGTGYVFPSPALGDPGAPWNAGNCANTLAALYVEMAEACGVELLREARTHVWRTTLHTVMREEYGIDEVTAAAMLGHTVAVAHRYYNDSKNAARVGERIRGRRDFPGA